MRLEDCDHARLLVRSLVRYAHCDFSTSTSQILMKLGTDVEHMCFISLSTFERSRSKFKVKNVILKIFKS